MEFVTNNVMYDQIEVDLRKPITFKECIIKYFKPCVSLFKKLNTKTEIIKKFSPNDIVFETNKECSICCNNFIKNEYILKLNCNHIYHTQCMKRWLEIKLECPICEILIHNSVKGRITCFNHNFDKII
jgi:hypothetical protein